jgi:hypothetical protein
VSPQGTTASAEDAAGVGPTFPDDSSAATSCARTRADGHKV